MRPRTTSSAVLLTVLAAVAGGSVEACRRDASPGAPIATATPAPSPSPALGGAAGDASASAPSPSPASAAPRPPVDRTLRVVAQGSMFASSAVLTADDHLVVTSGLLVYEPTAAGTLDLLGGGPGAYGTLYPGGDELLIGYLTSPQPDVVVSSAKGVDVWLGGAEGTAFHVDRTSITMLDAKAAPKTGASPSIVIGKASCSRVPSYDGKTYAACGAAGATGGVAARRSAFFTQDPSSPTSWKEAFALAEGVDGRGASVASDGTLHGADKAGDVVRCPAAAACEKLAVDASADGPAGASYRAQMTDIMDPSTNRYWQTVRVEPTAPASPAKPAKMVIEKVIARSADDVWVVGRVDASSVRLFLHASPASEASGRRARVFLPSEIDARVLARNTKAPAAWVGHCEQVFVRVASAKDRDALAAPAAALKARAAEIKAIVETKTDDEYRSPYSWAVVDGRLHEDEALGVVVLRRDAEGSLDRMERAVERLVDKLTPNPMARPQVFCTLPVPGAVHAATAD